MISDMADMKTWVKAYVTGTVNSAATQKERLTCIPIGKPNLAFGLGIGCSAGWFGYTGGITGYNTGAYYLPEMDATIIALGQHPAAAEGQARRRQCDLQGRRARAVPQQRPVLTARPARQRMTLLLPQLPGIVQLFSRAVLLSSFSSSVAATWSAL